MLSEQQAAREAIAQLVSTLDASVANARKEAALTSDVLQRIEGATTKLVEAQHAADQYLEGITGVLGAAHDTFALNVQRTLGTASTEFMTHLTQATGRLRKAIQELEVALEPGARQAA